MRLRRHDLALRSVGDEVIALDMASSRYLQANPSGAVLLRHLEQDRSREDCALVLQEAFGLAPERAQADADAFLAALNARGLLEE